MSTREPGEQHGESRWAEIRARFPTLERRTYLNSCAYGAISVDVVEALQQYIADRLDKGCDWDDWVQRNEAVRSAVAELLGADPNEWRRRVPPISSKEQFFPANPNVPLLRAWSGLRERDSPIDRPTRL